MTVNLFGGGQSRLLAFDRKWAPLDEHWYINTGWQDPHLPPPDKVFYFDRVVESRDYFKTLKPHMIVGPDNFPMLDILKEVEGAFPYFTSTVAYALAYAALQEPLRIRLWGIDLSDRPVEGAASEYASQLPCVMYWLGILAAHGTDIEVAEGSSVFADALRLYGDVTWRVKTFKHMGRDTALGT